MNKSNTDWFCPYCGYIYYQDAMDNRGGRFIVCGDCGAAFGSTVAPLWCDNSDEYIEPVSHEIITLAELGTLIDDNWLIELHSHRNKQKNNQILSEVKYLQRQTNERINKLLDGIESEDADND